MKFHKSYVQHIFKKVNQRVDALVKFEITIFSDNSNFVNPPPIVKDLLALTRSNFFVIDLLELIYISVGLKKMILYNNIFISRDIYFTFLSIYIYIYIYCINRYL